MHIVSVDSESVIKVWDVKKFKCIDSFIIDSGDEKVKQVPNQKRDKYLPQGLCILPHPLKLFIPGKSLLSF